MSDIRFNQWLHQSGTGGVSQDHIGNIGIGTTNPSIVVSAANTAVLNVGVITANNLFVNNAFNGDITGNVTGNISGATGTFSGNVDIADKIIHTGDTDTAMRFPADNTFAVDTAGSERLRIKSDGDVYIGNIAHSNDGGANSSYRTLTLTDTTNGAQLHLRGQSPKLFMDVTSGGNAEMYYDTGNLRILSGEPGGTSSEKLRITSGGHVNIGGEYSQTDSKVTIVDVSRPIAEATLNLQSSTTSGAADTGPVLRFYGHSGSEGRYHASIKGAKENGTSGNTAAYLAFNTRPAGGAMAERVRITSDGKLGHGTASPSSAFHGTVSSGGYGATFESTANGGESVVTIKGKRSDGTVRSAIFKYDNADMIRLGTSQSIPMRFETNDTERMRIGSDGKFYYATTSQGPHGGFFNIDASSSGRNGMNVKGTTANYAYISSAGGSSGDHIHFSNYSNNNQETGRIKDNQSNVTYYTSSDYRLKDNIVSITDGITRVKQLNPVRHTWINNPALGTVDGWIAHELDEVCPDAVDGEKDAVREDGSIKAQAADYGRITPLLAAALKEAITKIEALESRVTALEG